MNIAFLLELVRKLGPKLPQAWPDILVIVGALRRILALATGVSADDFVAATPTFGAAGAPSTEDAAELKSACANNGVDPAECDTVVAVFHAAEKTVSA